MKIRYRKAVTAASANDFIYVIFDNGDPVAKGSYDAMTKKLLTYTKPVNMKKFPKAKLNSLMKMATDAHRPDPLKFAVNRFINDYTDEYDKINSSCGRKSVKASSVADFNRKYGTMKYGKWELREVDNDAYDDEIRFALYEHDPEFNKTHESGAFESIDKAVNYVEYMEKMRDKDPIWNPDAEDIWSACGRKSVKAGYQLQFPYMVEGEFADGYTYTAGGNSEAECVETLADMQDKHGELVWYSGITDEDCDAGRRIDSSCSRKSVKSASGSIKNKSRNVQVYFWQNNAYNAVVFTDGEYWIVFDSD